MAVLFSSIFCVTAVGAHTPQKVEQKRAAVVESLYGYLPVAAAVLIGSNTTVDSLFAPAVRARIDPLGRGDGLQSVKAYFFQAVKVLDPNNAGVSDIHFNSLVARDDQVWVDVNITSAGFQSPELHEVGFFRFNDSNQIVSFDLTITQFARAASVLDPSNPAVTAFLISSTCTAHAQFCTGQLQQYDSFDACEAFMQSIPQGSWDYVSANSVVCRDFHAQLVPYRPDIECGSVGPTGAATCIDTPYNQYFQDSY